MYTAENTDNRFSCDLCGLLNHFIFMTALLPLFPLIDKSLHTVSLKQSTPFGQHKISPFLPPFLSSFPTSLIISYSTRNTLGYRISVTTFPSCCLRLGNRRICLKVGQGQEQPCAMACSLVDTDKTLNDSL